MQQAPINLGRGNPYFLLELLGCYYKQKLALHNIENMSYAPDKGFPELIKITKRVIKETTGLDYKYICITNGATQALNSILRLRNDRGYTHVVTLKHGYPFYTDMINRAGLIRIEDNDLSLPKNEKSFRIIDSPSNPFGIQVGSGDSRKDVWDAVYHNKIYSYSIESAPIPKHYVMVGSYSKLLGVTGARVGFIATNHESFYKEVSDWSLKDIVTVSYPSQELIVDILNKIDLHVFMKAGNKYLNYNREQFQKIEYLFDMQPVQCVGMFYCVEADKKALDTLKKCGINYIELGGDTIRLSMGQLGNVTKEAVRRILKEDKIHG